MFPRQRRSCDHLRGCGSYPTTSGQGYSEGVGLVRGDVGDQIIVAPLSGYYSFIDNSTATIQLTPSEASYRDITFTITNILPSIQLTQSPMFIRGGERLGVFTSDPQQLNNDDDEYYIHIAAYKTIGSEIFTINPTQYLQPIHNPQVDIRYDCNDLVTYIGQMVVDRRSLAPESPTTVPYGSVIVDDAIPDHEFTRPVDHILHSQGTILSGASVEVLSSSTFIMVGPIPVQFGKNSCNHQFQLNTSILAFSQIFELLGAINLTTHLISACSPTRLSSLSLPRLSQELRVMLGRTVSCMPLSLLKEVYSKHRYLYISNKTSSNGPSLQGM